MRKTGLKGIALAALALGFAAQPVRADIATSMTASVVGTDIVFFLTPTQPGTYWLHDLTITSSSWIFDGNVSSIQIRQGGPDGIDRTANYTPAIVDGNLTFESNNSINLAQAALAPIWVKVGLASAGTDPSGITYYGDFFTKEDPLHPGQPKRLPIDSFGGTVAPEPISMVLFGTGLVGIAGARRRRKGVAAPIA